MSTILKQLVKDRKSDTIQDEIRKRVLARYSELQGIENEKSELEATLDALQEMTGLPRHEIDSIALEVQEKNSSTNEIQEKDHLYPEIDSTDFGVVLDHENQKISSAKRGFVHHLVPYVMVNTTLVILNAITSSFPWSMFPLFFWGIGVVSHYLSAVYWPEKDWKRRMALVIKLVQQILYENSPAYKKGDRSDFFMGLLRLTMTQSSQTNLEEYLKSADPSLSDAGIKQISTQIVAIQEQYISLKSRRNRQK